MKIINVFLQFFSFQVCKTDLHAIHVLNSQIKGVDEVGEVILKGKKFG